MFYILLMLHNFLWFFFHHKHHNSPSFSVKAGARYSQFSQCCFPAADGPLIPEQSNNPISEKRELWVILNP